MKINTERTVAIVAKRLIASIPFSVVYFLVAFIVGIIVIPILKMQAIEEVINLVLLFSAVVAFIYLAIKSLEAYLFSKGTYIELTENAINVHSTGFKTLDLSLKLEEIQALNVLQQVIDKAFRLSIVNIKQISGDLKISGFNYKDAKNFVEEYNKASEK